MRLSREDVMKRRFLLLSLAMAIPSPALASWELSSGDDYCAIAGNYEDDGNSTITMMAREDGSFVLFVANENWSIVKDRTYAIDFVFDDQVFGGEAVGFQTPGEKGFMIGGDEAMATAFAKANRLGIVKDGETVVLIVRLNGTAAVMARMRGCVQSMRRAADIVRAEQRALDRKRETIPADPFFDPDSTIPLGNAGRWATNDDYPAAAMREEREGKAGFKLTVDPSGAVIGCQITSSTGHADLDAETCSLVTRRARFNVAPPKSPSRYYENFIRWQIPR